jgi:hypothetical protein
MFYLVEVPLYSIPYSGTFLPVVFQFITVGQVPLYGIPSGHSCLSILLTDIRISLILSVRQVPKGIPSANV